MRMRSFLTSGLACTLLLGASSCDSKDGRDGSKEKKKKPVAETPILEPVNYLLISEIVPHAEHDLEDADGDRSDWIELHNSGSEAIPLAGFALTDDKKIPLKWVLPERSLEPGGFVIVFTSGKDRGSPDGELHANFKLAGNGEYLALLRLDDQHAVHTFAPIFPKVPKGKSYGYAFRDGTVDIERLMFFDTPSPGKPNVGAPVEPDAPESNP